MTTVRISWLALGVLLAAGCAEGTEPLTDRCVLSLAVITPDPSSVTVGDSAMLQAHLTASPTCLPADTVPADLRWGLASWSDPTLMRVDSLTGVTHGEKVGTAGVRLYTSQTHTDLAYSTVNITP